MQFNACLRPGHTDDWRKWSCSPGTYGAVPDLFEVAQLTCKLSHAHAQTVSIPTENGHKVEEQLRRDGRATGMVCEEDADAASEDAARSGESYFEASLPDGSKMVHGVKAWEAVQSSIWAGRHRSRV